MRPPCELVVTRLLPRVKARMIQVLVEEGGWSLSSAAKALGISVTSASKYKRILASMSVPEDLDELAISAAKRILAGSLEREEFIELLCRECLRLRVEMVLCDLHRREVELPKPCRACLKSLSEFSRSAGERLSVLEELERGLAILASAPSFASLVPQVRTNLVMRIEEAKSIGDVAGFPGRLTVVKGRVRALSPPEFGASRHMARLLLTASKLNPKIRAALCIRYDEGVKCIIERLGLEYTIVERGDKGLEEQLVELGKVPTVLIDAGGYGIEPVAYIFGENALRVAKLGVEIARAYESLAAS